MNPISLECDVCETTLNSANLGFVKNPKDSEKVVKCKSCHDVERPKKESSYITL